MKHARRAFHFSLPLLFVAVGIMAVLAFSSQTLLGYLTQSATINKVQEVDTNAAGMTQAQTTAAKKLNTAAAAAESARTNTERQNTTLDLLVAGQTYENLTYSAAGRPAATTYEQARQEAIQTLSGNSPNAGGYITTDSNGNPTGLTEKAISSLITNVPTTTPSNSSTSTTGRDCSVTCATQGAPVCKGDYVFTGGGLDESGGAYHGAGSAPRRECTMCLGDEKKTFDGSYDCGKLVADGKPVIMAPDVDPASIGLPKTYINANGQEVNVVTNPCFENIGGTYRQVPFGQADSKGNICGMNGAYVAQDTFNKDMNSVCSSAGKIYDAAKKQCVTKPTTPTTPTTQSGSAGANNGTSAGAPVAGTTPIKCGPGFVVDQSNSQFCKPTVSGDAVDRYAKSCTDKGSNYVYNYQTGICSTKSAAVSSPVRTLSCGLQSNGSYVSCGTGSSGTNVIHFCPTGKVWTMMGCQTTPSTARIVNASGVYTGGESVSSSTSKDCKYGVNTQHEDGASAYYCNYPNGKSKPDLVPVSFGTGNSASGAVAPITSSSDYPNAGKECDGTLANKDANGNYTSTPSCSQICGAVGSKPVNGKLICNGAPENEPTQTSAVETTSSPRIVSDNSTPVTFKIGEDCHSMLDCKGCPGGVYTSLKITGQTNNKLVCGDKTQNSSLANSETTIVRDNSAQFTMKVGETCNNALFSSTKCSKCPGGVSSVVRVSSGNSPNGAGLVSVCGSKEELSSMDLSNAQVQSSRGTNAIVGSTVGGVGGALTCALAGLGCGPLAPGCSLVGAIACGLGGAAIGGGVGAAIPVN